MLEQTPTQPPSERLKTLCRHDGDVQQVLRDHPELLPGLDEYLKWRDRRHHQIGETPAQQGLAHPVATAIAQLGPESVEKPQESGSEITDLQGKLPARPQ